MNNTSEINYHPYFNENQNHSHMKKGDLVVYQGQLRKILSSREVDKKYLEILIEHIVIPGWSDGYICFKKCDAGCYCIYL